MSISEHLAHAVKKHQSKGQAAKAGKASEAGEISRMTIEKAENGFMVTHHEDRPEGPYHEPKKHLFKHTESGKMAKHIQHMMGGGKDPKEDESANAKDKTR